LNNEKSGGAIMEGRETLGAFNTRDHNDKQVDLANIEYGLKCCSNFCRRAKRLLIGRECG
jgi:hypothetical protein